MSVSLSPWLKARAKAMRAEMTPQEKAVWRLLHDGELVALNWRRQAAFGKYVLDFVSHAARLVIEVDGAKHREIAQAKHDAQRSAWLMGQGYRVLRVWNAEAAKEKDGVWRAIHAAASETRAVARMRRWRKEHLEKIQAINAAAGAPTSPSMGEVASVSEPEGVRPAVREEEPPEALQET